MTGGRFLAVQEIIGDKTEKNFYFIKIMVVMENFGLQNYLVLRQPGRNISSVENIPSLFYQLISSLPRHTHCILCNLNEAACIQVYLRWATQTECFEFDSPRAEATSVWTNYLVYL